MTEGWTSVRSFFPSRRILRSGAFPVSACLDAVAIFCSRVFWADGLLRQKQSPRPTSHTFVLLEGSNATGNDQEVGCGWRGFRFIKGEKEEMFFHHSEVKGATMEELREGQKVEYQVGQGKKGPCATSVRVV